MLALEEFFEKLKDEKFQAELLSSKDNFTAFFKECLSVFDKTYKFNAPTIFFSSLREQLEDLSVSQAPSKEDINSLLDRIEQDKGISLIVEILSTASQRWFMNRMRWLGYGPLGDGECFGIANMAMQAFILGETESFNERLAQISALSENDCQDLWDKIKHKKASEAEIQTWVDILAFFNGVYLYQDPDFLSIRKQNTAKTKEFVRPNKPIANKNLDPVSVLDFLNYYSEDDIDKYLNLLKENVGSVPFSINIFCRIKEEDKTQAHAINVSYDPIKKSWIFTDANKLPQVEYKSEKLLAKAIYNAFYATTNIEGILHQKADARINPILLGNIVYIAQENLTKVKKQQDLSRLFMVEDVKLYETFFPIAVYSDLKSVYKYLTEHGIDANEELRKAIKSKNFLYANELIDMGAKVLPEDLNFDSCDGSDTDEVMFLYNHGVRAPTLLAKVCSKDNFKLVLYLLQNGIIPNEDALITAAIKNQHELVQIMLQHGAKISQQTFTKFASCFSRDIAELLKASIDTTIESTQLNVNELITLACKENNKELLQILIKDGAEVSEELLNTSLEFGHIECAELIVKAGVCLADYSLEELLAFWEPSVKNRTILHFIIKNGAPITEEMLLFAYETNRTTKLLHELLSAGVNPTEKLALEVIGKNDLETFNLLLSKGLNVNKSMLETASRATLPNIAIISAIVDKSIKPDDSMVFLAAFNNNAQLVEFYLSKGATISQDCFKSIETFMNNEVRNLLERTIKSPDAESSSAKFFNGQGN